MNGGGGVEAVDEGGDDSGGGGDSGGGTSPGLDVEVSVNDDWGAGYCIDVVVTNTTAAPIQWTVALEVEGTIDNTWNAELLQGAPRRASRGSPGTRSSSPVEWGRDPR
jgi:cellulase/cellobiase CelA1